MNSNPIMNDVLAAFSVVPDIDPLEVSIDRSGVVLHQGGHFQGVQWFPDQSLLVITSDSTDVAYFVACEMTTDGQNGRARAPVTMSNYFQHAGGCQSFGNVLVAGVEETSKEQTSEVQFWDFTRFPMQLVQMTIPRSGRDRIVGRWPGFPEYPYTAGAVGMSTLGRGALLAVASFNAVTVDFYTSEGDPFNGTAFHPPLTWWTDEADKTNWIDENWGAYQSINLITQADGQLFLTGLHRNSATEDWMDLYTINLEVDPPFVLTKVAKKHMYCTLGCSFDRGSGIFIESPDVFKVFAVPEGSGDWQNGTTINANIFAPT